MLVHENTIRTNMLQRQKEELEITWLLRNAPSLDHSVVLDQQLLPVVNPEIYVSTRKLYGTPLPTLAVADLSRMKPRDVNDTMRNLLPLVVTETNGSMPPGTGCNVTVGRGSRADLTVPGGQAASVVAIGRHAASQLAFSTWAVGAVPDGGYYQRGVSSDHGLRIKLPDTGLGLPWYLRLTDNGGSSVAVCVG